MSDISYEASTKGGQTTLDKLFKNVQEEGSVEEFEKLLQKV